MSHAAGGLQATPIPNPHQAPRLRWQNEFLLSLISFLMAGAILLAEDYSPSRILQGYAPHVATGLLISGLLAPFLQWAFQFVATLYRRFRDYPPLHALATSTSNDMLQFRESIYQLLHSLPYLEILEVDKAAYIRTRVYLVIRRNGSRTIRVGDPLTILDFNDGMTLATATITEVRAVQYYAVAGPGMDPLFRGLVIQKGEVSVLPNIKAVYLPTEVLNERQAK